MEAPGFLKEGRWNRSRGPKRQLFLLCGEIVVVARVSREGERTRKTSGMGPKAVAVLLFGEVPEVLDWAWSRKQRLLGEEAKETSLDLLPGTVWPSGCDHGCGHGAGQGGASLQALCSAP